MFVTKYVAAVIVAVVSLGAHAQISHAQEATTSPTMNVHNAMEVEQQVREFFADVAVMVAIARCESKFRQYTDGGNVLRGGAGGGMVGVFQFNERMHSSAALTRGFDITTLEGNIGYAKHLYEHAGTDPWISSFGCWNSALSTKEGMEDSVLNRDLSFGQTHSQVRTLQELLNRAGFVVADSGPGSLGNETIMFGNFTRAAVRKFQCEQHIACGGNEYTTGYGLLGEQTRRALLSYAVDAKPMTSTRTTTNVTKNSATSAEKEREALQARINELLRLVAELQKHLALQTN